MDRHPKKYLKDPNRLFDPTIELNDSMDDNLEEEQSLPSNEAQAKLSNLKLYDNGNTSGTSSAEESNSDRLTAGSPSSDNASASKYQIYDNLTDTQDPEQYGSRLLRSVSRTHSDNDEKDDEYDFSPKWRKKTIMVGSNYQASIPDGLSTYGDVLPYDNEDKLLWDPSQLSEDEVEEYLQKSKAKKKEGQSVYSLPLGKHLRDDEQALFILLQCGHNMTEALRRRRITAPQPSMSLWSEEECRNFETGLRSYGKNFHLTQQNKVRTRSVGELVQFYYLWKKTERHDVFAHKSRLEKKKYTLHPGVTDFMDRFLDEQEQIQERSSSPFVFGGEPVISAKSNLLDKNNVDF